MSLSVQILLVFFLLLRIYFLSKQVNCLPLIDRDSSYFAEQFVLFTLQGKRILHLNRNLNLHKPGAIGPVDVCYSNCVKFIANEVS